MTTDANGVVRRVVALYDIHGNLPALDAVLAQPEVARADVVVVGGDNLLGPMPREVLDRLMSLGSRARFIRGNCDRMMVDAFDGNPTTRAPAAVQENIKWAAGQLDKGQRDFLAELPLTLTVSVESIGPVLFCHATPSSDEPIFTVRTPADRVASMLGDVEAGVVVCGHTHMQFDRLVGNVRIINAGSVGMPFGPRGAHWLSVGPSVDFQRTSYDFQSAAERIAKTSYPQAEMFASKHVVNPPSEEEMLAVFEGVRG
jgi:predicted phosphodiesterase